MIRVITFNDTIALEKFLNKISRNNIIQITYGQRVCGYSYAEKYTVIYESNW